MTLLLDVLGDALFLPEKAESLFFTMTESELGYSYTVQEIWLIKKIQPVQDFVFPPTSPFN